MSEPKSGAHMGVIRSWMQRAALNGDTVKWGSDEWLNLRPQTVLDMERLAQSIADPLLKELEKSKSDYASLYQEMERIKRGVDEELQRLRDKVKKLKNEVEDYRERFAGDDW